MGQQAAGTVLPALRIALLIPWAVTAMAQSSGPASALVQPKPSAQDVLAAMVHHAATIFAGEVYAIRMPQGTNQGPTNQGPTNQGTTNPGLFTGRISSSRPDAVDIEFRVDVAIRGTSIGSDYVLRMPADGWQQSPPIFALHQRAVNFLRPPDASGFSGPVQGEGDQPGQPVGVLSIDDNNQVDLSRVARLVTARPLAENGAPEPDSTMPDGNGAAGSAPVEAPHVPGVSKGAGRDTLISGSTQGQMPELNGSSVPFLALVRDVTVLSAAEAPGGGP
ncbi:MAG: hypothetical protein JWP44_4820 [Mucilaginibacter sp.]|nr:hypothetical protein [Mucilaginibacter sp.]